MTFNITSQNIVDFLRTYSSAEINTTLIETKPFLPTVKAIVTKDLQNASKDYDEMEDEDKTIIDGVIILKTSILLINQPQFNTNIGIFKNTESKNIKDIINTWKRQIKDYYSILGVNNISHATNEEIDYESIHYDTPLLNY